MTVNVLGVGYTVEFKEKSQDKYLEQADGYCDSSIKCIAVRKYTEEECKDPGALGDLDAYQKKVLRHELVHAFLYESGLCCNANGTDCWPKNEEVVDWFAIQGPKLCDAWKAAGAL